MADDKPVTVIDPSWTFRHLADTMLALGVRPDGVVHIGADHGEEVPTYLEIGFREIALVEPDPERCAEIRQNLWWHSPQIHLYEGAVTAREGPVPFYRVAAGSAWSGLKLAQHRGPSEMIEVDTVRADWLQHLHPEANVMVIDTQGTELDALCTADLSKLDMVIVETHENGVDGAHPGELGWHLANVGWRVAVIWDRTGGWTDTVIVPAVRRG